MTLDPIFDFNPDLDDVSNIHTAEQIIACDDDSWVVELPQGDEVRGKEAGTWPMEVGDQPAALRILQMSTSGDGTLWVPVAPDPPVHCNNWTSVTDDGGWSRLGVTTSNWTR